MNHTRQSKIGTCVNELYVPPTGNDAWSGRLPEANAARTDGPLATLARAQAVARGLQQAGGVTVTVGGGEYVLTEPLAFTAEDSGTAGAPVVYRAAEGEQVRLSGGVRIADWRPVEDAATLARLPAEARGNVFQADLRANGVDDFGTMDSAPAWAHSDPGLEVFFRGERMTLARYPNEGFLRIAAAEDLQPGVGEVRCRRRLHGSEIADAAGAQIGLENVAARRFRQSCQRRRILDWSPVGDTHPAGKPHLFPFRRPIHDRRPGRAAVLCGERQRFGQRVLATAYRYRDATDLLQAARDLPRPRQRRQRPVRPRRVRFGQSPAPDVIAVGGYVKSNTHVVFLHGSSFPCS